MDTGNVPDEIKKWMVDLNGRQWTVEACLIAERAEKRAEARPARDFFMPLLSVWISLFGLFQIWDAAVLGC